MSARNFAATVLRGHAVLDAVDVWVEEIHDHPSFWVGDTELAMLRAALARTPKLVMKGEHCTCGSGACGPTYNWDQYRR